MSAAPPPHGGLAEEAARLVAALQDAASGWTARGDGAESGDGAHEHTATPAACRVCPLCQAIAVVQGLRPETVQHLSDAAASLAAAVADLVAAGRAGTAGSGAADPADTPADTPPAAPPETPPDTPEQPAPPRDARLQRIDITVRDD